MLSAGIIRKDLPNQFFAMNQGSSDFVLAFWNGDSFGQLGEHFVESIFGSFCKFIFSNVRREPGTIRPSPIHIAQFSLR